MINMNSILLSNVRNKSISLAFDILNNRLKNKDQKNLVAELFNSQEAHKIIANNFSTLLQGSGASYPLYLISLLVLGLTSSEGFKDDIPDLVKNNNKEKILFIGLKQLFQESSKQKTFQLPIVNIDEEILVNKYELLERRFYIDTIVTNFNWKIQALIRILYNISPSDFEKLLLFDKSNIILLSISYEILHIPISERLLIQLLTHESLFCANIAMKILLKNLEEILESNELKRISITEKNRDIILKKIISNSHLQENGCFRILNEIPDERREVLLLGYLLCTPSNKRCHLLEAQFFLCVENDLLIKTIKESIEIKKLIELSKLFSLFNKWSRQRIYKGLKNEEIYIAFKDKIIAIIDSVDEYGISLYIDRMEFIRLIDSFPIEFLEEIVKSLEQKYDQLWNTELDKLIRFKLWLHDRYQSIIIKELINLIRQKINSR